MYTFAQYMQSKKTWETDRQKELMSTSMTCNWDFNATNSQSDFHIKGMAFINLSSSVISIKKWQISWKSFFLLIQTCTVCTIFSSIFRAVCPYEMLHFNFLHYCPSICIRNYNTHILNSKQCFLHFAPPVNKNQEIMKIKSGLILSF